MKSAAIPLMALAVLAAFPAVPAAQTPTGTISGRVTDSEGGVIPGVRVSITSPSLIGSQSTATSGNGDYILRGLPAGPYTVTFALAGFNTLTRVIDIAPTQTATVSVEMRPAVVTEAITVTTTADSFVDTVQGAQSLTSELVRHLPTARTLLSYVDLTPAVHATGPDGNRTINGSMSFENVYLLNGVQITDNLRGEPLSLFIEDAIDRTTVASSGVSAEYGRFGGGIVNAITKSGGDSFGGSFRTTFTNDNWRTVTPEDEPKVDATVPTYEFTFGGPLLRNRTWFFGAGRLREITEGRETVGTDHAYEYGLDEKRLELKITQALAPGHRIHGSFLGISAKETNSAWPSEDEILDLNSLNDREQPENLASFGYSGTFGTRFFLEGQYSVRNLSFVGSGGKDTDLIRGTTMCSPSIDCLGGVGTWFWAPAFCGVCADEERDHNQLTLKGSYFASTRSGAHNVTFGYDRYTDKLLSDNHQAASDFHVWSTDTIINGGTVYPVIEPGSTFIINWPILQPSQGTKYRTEGLFFNDNWRVGQQLSLQLGLRYDRNHGVDASENLIADDSAISPRLGLTFTPNHGATTFNASFSRYVAALANNVASSASAAGSPAILAYIYAGDPINNGGPLVPTDQALTQVFDWFNGFDDADKNAFLFFVDIPGLSTRIPESLKSPHTDEIAAGIGQQLGNNASLRVDVVDRQSGNFYLDKLDTTTGTVTDEFGQVFDVRHVVNSDALDRRFRALNAQFNYQRSRASIGVVYSLSRLWGNINGETSGSGPISSSVLTYPEYSDPSWSNPEGDLALDQRHRARFFGSVRLPFVGDANVLTLGFNQLVESGTPYGAVGGIDTDLYVDNPGYATPPSFGGVTYYFTPRDAFRTEAMFRTDLSLNYARRFSSNARRSAEVFVQLQLLNTFNRFQVFNITGNEINTTVFTAAQDPDLLPFNPFIETPVEGVHWRKGDSFGEPTSRGAYTLPRTFRFSLGLRF